jgi:hypothetical protein
MPIMTGFSYYGLSNKIRQQFPHRLPQHVDEMKGKYIG